MNCPNCHQPATSFQRYAFSLQGVTLFKSMQGYLRCQHCGTLLRVISFGKSFWAFFIPTIIVLALFVFVYPNLLSTVGPGTTAAVWIVILLLIVFIFGYGLWRYGKVERVDLESPLSTHGKA